MNIPTQEFVINELQKIYQISLNKIPSHRVFYKGVINDNEEILICTPQSKLHKNGHGWIDITYKQLLFLKKAKYSILAFRIEGNKVYYINFDDLEKHLTIESMLNNNKEGDHWKLYIWQNNIEIRGNQNRLLITSNKFSVLKLTNYK